MGGMGFGHRSHRRAVLALMLIGVLVALPALAGAAVTGIDGMSITMDDHVQMTPRIWDGTVVWADDRNGNRDIYSWADNVTTPISVRSGAQSEPAIGRDWIVWMDNRNGNFDIYGIPRNGGAETSVVTAAGDQRVPDTYGRYVVWEDWRNGNGDIYARDLVTGTEFPVCVATGDQRTPAVWGDVFVWLDERAGLPGVWFWDRSVGGQPWPLVYTTNETLELDICQEWVVWSEYYGGSWEIRAFNLSTERAVTVGRGAGTQDQPSIDGDWVVFRDTQPGNPKIGFYDLLAGEYYDVFTTAVPLASPDMHLGVITNIYADGDGDVSIGGPMWTHDAQEIWGSDRYQTAAAIALAAFPQGAPSVLIATGTNFPDALGAAALAGQENIPILLTDGNELSPACEDAIVDLGVDDDVWIIGGTSAISDHVVEQIANAIAADIDPPKRIAGGDRYQTALAIANEISGGSGNLDEPYAFVATGLNYPDALAASSISYALDIPIYLVPGTSIPAATMDQMQADGVEYPVIVGGTGVVSTGVETALKGRFGNDNVYRVWGGDRYETAYEIAMFARDFFGFGASGMCVATGQSFPDALAGSQLAGARYAPMLLTRSDALSLPVQDFCTGHEQEIRYVTFLGGPNALNAGVRTTLRGWLE